MSTPTNIPETPMGETEQDSFFGSKEKFQQQLQDIFQTILRLTGPDHFDQLCQWMEYKQYYTIDTSLRILTMIWKTLTAKVQLLNTNGKGGPTTFPQLLPKTEMFYQMDDT